MNRLTRLALDTLREQYGDAWLPFIAEKWEQHESLEELTALVTSLEGRR